MRIAAIGRGRILLDTISALLASGHDVPVIATWPESAESDLPNGIWAGTAHDLGAAHLDHVLPPDQLRAARCDLAVSVNWRTRIDPEVRAAFPRGILNAHGGDLPRYRGNAPFAWALLNGEATVGFTVHEMNDELDAGPIYLKRFVPVTPDTYIGDLYRALAKAVPEMFDEVIRGIAAGTMNAQPQRGAALRCYPRGPEDGQMDWRRSAIHLARLVRASAEPFTGAFTTYRGARLTIWRADAVHWPEAYCAVPGQVLARNAAAVAIATGDGALHVTEVETTSGRTTAAVIVRSTRDRLT
jgi:UDP-4-amino-4-deoxy-L-arabinose formyltransferase/UDP-glucuronic acid dehydrogenase (UDP-4-keto-hexauronic acid decarboxylating)